MTTVVEIAAKGGRPVFAATPESRLRRQLGRLGYAQSAADGSDATVILRADHVYTNDVVTSLAEAAAGVVLVDDSGAALGARLGDGRTDDLRRAVTDGAAAPAGSDAQRVDALVASQDERLRKKAEPVAMSAEQPRLAEKALFAAAYKGATDLVTKYAWPVPALAATRWSAAHGLTPNQITAASAVLVLAALALFWHGWFLTGLVVAYAMVFLDTVDGKLARVTLTYSRFGNVFDHGIDLIHPPFWWWAWAVGCAATGQPLADGGWTLGVILVGYVAQRLEEGWFLLRFGIAIHIWRPFDSRFREITARRNPNLVILTVFTLAGSPREGLMAVAVWVAVCFVVHLVRIVQAHLAARHGPLSSWLAEP